MLESVVAERKLVLGDEVLEITASDIKTASGRIQVYRPASAGSRSTEFVMRAYIVIGISMMIGAFFYPQFTEIYATNRTQGLIFLTGASMAAAGWLFSVWMQARSRRIPDDDAETQSASKRVRPVEATPSPGRDDG